MTTQPTAARTTAIIERCQALFEDLDLGAVKAWKAAVPGRKAIGYMPVYVPRELVHARACCRSASSAAATRSR